MPVVVRAAAREAAEGGGGGGGGGAVAIIIGIYTISIRSIHAAFMVFNTINNNIIRIVVSTVHIIHTILLSLLESSGKVRGKQQRQSSYAFVDTPVPQSKTFSKTSMRNLLGLRGVIAEVWRHLRKCQAVRALQVWSAGRPLAQ